MTCLQMSSQFTLQVKEKLIFYGSSWEPISRVSNQFTFGQNSEQFKLDGRTGTQPVPCWWKRGNRGFWAGPLHHKRLLLTTSHRRFWVKPLTDGSRYNPWWFYVEPYERVPGGTSKKVLPGTKKDSPFFPRVQLRRVSLEIFPFCRYK